MTANRAYGLLETASRSGSMDKTIELVDELPRLATLHLRYNQDTQDLSLWPIEGGTVRLRRPWNEIAADPVLHQAVLWWGVAAGELGT